MDPFVFHAGSVPLLVSVPHAGTHVPGDVAARMTEAARDLPDADWHVDRLYGFARELGASMLVATHARYVVDVNRPPDDAPLYPGRAGSGLVPMKTFAGHPLWRSGEAPQRPEIEQRLERFWRPYHDRLVTAIDAMLMTHGHALVWEAHSIRSVVPRLFEGRLPDLNLGTNGGASCHPRLARALFERAERASGLTSVLDGRFRGGYVTRHYGAPDRHVHAVQLELAQRSYMDEERGAWDEARAERLRPVLRGLLTRFLDEAAALER